MNDRLAAQKGNTLILILLAIFLMGGLAVLLSRTGGQSEETGSTEQASILTSDMLKYATGIAGGVQSLIAHGCSEGQISFDADDAPAALSAYENGNAPIDRSCHVFYAEGAGINYQLLKTTWLDTTKSAQIGYGLPYFTSADAVIGVGQDGVSGADLILVIPYIKKALCTEILHRNNVRVADVPQDVGPIDPAAYDAKKFTGSYTATASIGDDTTLLNYSLIAKKKGFCVQSTGTYPLANTYHFYQVLIAR